MMLLGEKGVRERGVYRTRHETFTGTAAARAKGTIDGAAVRAPARACLRAGQLPGRARALAGGGRRGPARRCLPHGGRPARAAARSLATRLDAARGPRPR